MKTSELLANLAKQGVQLCADNGKLSIRSPKGVLTAQLQAELLAHKAEILAFLRQTDMTVDTSSSPGDRGLSIQTIGRLIGGVGNKISGGCQSPIIDPKVMAQKLIVTFRPLPPRYKQQEVLRFRSELIIKLQEYGVRAIAWDDATTDFYYEVELPLIKKKQKIKTRVVKTEVDAVIDVERLPSLIGKFKILVAENLYKLYSKLFLKQQKMSVSRIAKLIGWAEEHVAKYVQDPTKTQIITITNLDNEFVHLKTPYQQKIKLGLNTLVRTFSELVIGVSPTQISILNMNLSDSLYSKYELDSFVLNSLIPKVFVPIMPLSMSRFTIEQYDPSESVFAHNLVTLGKELAVTGLFPPGSKLSEVINRKSHRDIVDVIVHGRTGVSYGFVAYVEAPQYIGKQEITVDEWEDLLPVEEFSFKEVRQNTIGRRYIKTQIGQEDVFKQIPDIWLVSSRSGSNKTDLKLKSDIIRIGLKERLFLQLPQGINPELTDIKPSYDIYVMLAISMAAALYTPALIQKGAPIVHFHGYPAFEWFKSNEYYVGVDNPSVPCGTYESGVLNFLGISRLAQQHGEKIVLASLLEPDHGTNIIALDLEYLLERLKAGNQKGQIELGGKHFDSLKDSIFNEFKLSS